MGHFSETVPTKIYTIYTYLHLYVSCIFTNYRIIECQLRQNGVAICERPPTQIWGECPQLTVSDCLIRNIACQLQLLDISESSYVIIGIKYAVVLYCGSVTPDGWCNMRQNHAKIINCTKEDLDWNPRKATLLYLLKSLTHNHSTRAGPVRTRCVIIGTFDGKWEGRTSVRKRWLFTNAAHFA